MKKIISSHLFILFLLFLTKISYGQNQFQQYLKSVPSSFNFSSNKVLFAQDIPYDNLDLKQQLFDLFIPSQTGSYPLVINIHGGGFIDGSKSDMYSNTSGRQEIEYFVNQGIAYASIEYRVIINNGPDNEGVIKPMSDVKRALQFIRHYAKDLKIDPEKIVLTGNSAGAGTALWLNTHDDMADPNATDPVLKQSTKVCGVNLVQPQATYDLTRWETDVFFKL